MQPPPGTFGLFWGPVLLKALIGCYVFLFSENDSRESVPGLRLKDPLPLPHSLLLSIFFFLLLVSEFVSSPRHPSGSPASWLSSSLTQPKQEKKQKENFLIRPELVRLSLRNTGSSAAMGANRNR